MTRLEMVSFAVIAVLVSLLAVRYRLRSEASGSEQVKPRPTEYLEPNKDAPTKSDRKVYSVFSVNVLIEVNEVQDRDAILNHVNRVCSIVKGSDSVKFVRLEKIHGVTGDGPVLLYKRP